MMQPLDRDLTPQEQEVLAVLAHQQGAAQAAVRQIDALLVEQANAIEETERLLTELGATLLPSVPPIKSPRSMPEPQTWEELVAEAERNLATHARFNDILAPARLPGRGTNWLAAAATSMRSITWTRSDWTIGGVAGVVASLVDVFLIQMPSTPRISRR